MSTLEVDWGHFPSEADKAWAERIIAEDPHLTFHLRQLMDDAALCELMGKASLAVVREKFDLRVRNERSQGLCEGARCFYRR
ncbi:MAG: hypothetical protein IPH53_05150 [Flavobacteriales bacterium]|nr:hypothetical protein [Flavobacteriales bacterium]